MSRNALATLWVLTVLLFLGAHNTAVLAQNAWTDADVGSVGQPGGSQESDGTFSVNGAGADIWGTADAFHFTYWPLQGDGDIYTLVRSQTATNPYAKAGVMIRQSLDPAAPEIILDVKPDGGIEFMDRAYAGGQTFFITGAQAAYPVWLRLTRRGQYVAAFVSTAAECPGMSCDSWTQLGDWRLWVWGPALIGLAVTSHDTSTLNTADLDFVHEMSLEMPWQQTDLYTETEPDSAFTLRSQSGTTFVVPGAGTDIWGTVDSFKYVWQQTTPGNATLIARVTEDNYMQPNAKAGIMMRSSLNPRQANVLLDVKPDGGIEFMMRPSYAAETQFLAGGSQPLPAWLKLVENGDQYTAFTSGDGTNWVEIGATTVSLSPNGASILAGLATTSHGDPTPPSWGPNFDNVSLSADTPTNLLFDSGFESDTPPGFSSPGWSTDRAIAAVSETAEPHSGLKNGACRQATNDDCGLYQDVVAPTSGTYTLTVYANADRPGVIVGANVNGVGAASTNVAVRGTGNYGAAYTLTLTANRGDTIRVWLYSPATPGSAVIDDVVLAFTP